MVSASDYGLFLSDDDPRKGIWLESGRTLDYYMLRNGVRHKSHMTPSSGPHTPGTRRSEYANDSAVNHANMLLNLSW